MRSGREVTFDCSDKSVKLIIDAMAMTLFHMCEKNTRVVVQACCGVCSADLNTYGTVHCWLKMLIGKLSEFLEI